jgi:hypothetical protein
VAKTQIGQKWTGKDVATNDAPRPKQAFKVTIQYFCIVQFAAVRGVKYPAGKLMVVTGNKRPEVVVRHPSTNRS